MPQFSQQGDFDTISFITGPSHVLLGIEFSEKEKVVPMGLIKRPRVGASNHDPLDEVRIIEAIQAGVAAANAETGAKLAVAQAFYIEDDSPRYELFQQCAYLLAVRRAD
jgi:hypothetical protein